MVRQQTIQLIHDNKLRQKSNNQGFEHPDSADFATATQSASMAGFDQNWVEPLRFGPGSGENQHTNIRRRTRSGSTRFPLHRQTIWVIQTYEKHEKQICKGTGGLFHLSSRYPLVSHSRSISTAGFADSDRRNSQPW